VSLRRSESVDRSWECWWAAPPGQPISRAWADIRGPAGLLVSQACFALGSFVVVRHLEAGPLEAAFDIETLVVLAAVEDGLVAARLGRDEVERLDDAQAQLLALLVLGNGDVFDVSNLTEIVDAGARRPTVSARSRREMG